MPMEGKDPETPLGHGGREGGARRDLAKRVEQGGSLRGKKKVFLNGSFKKRPRVICSTMVGGDWRFAVGDWWQLAVGGWRLVAGGWWLKAVGGW